MSRLRIDFISDVVCPWCAIGLASLQSALERLDGGVQAELHFEPFELNPQMPAEGEDITEHLSRKYGIDEHQIARNREALRERGAAVGFAFGPRERTWNTFDAHRLLHWAGLEGRQQALKLALLEAYHGRAENISDPAVLVRLAAQAGLDAERAREVLASNAFAAEVRERERYWLERGIHAVPAVVIDGQHLISGGQPVEVFERALRQLAA
jgi:predicted DsbA family dithiol-disulfide isomerase